jgi:TolB-like protein
MTSRNVRFSFANPSFVLRTALATEGKAAALRYSFGKFLLDTGTRELRRDDKLVSVEPKVFDLLSHLIVNRERVVSKDDLIAAVWRGRIVSESAMTTCINAARISIGDSGDTQRLIKTVPRRGIRFIGAVQELQAPAHGAIADTLPKQLRPALPLPDKPSIAVLPFQNMSGDPEQEYFADGIVEDITTGLSRSRLLFVIGRSSSFTYKNKPVDVKEVGRELGVRYVVEGSVRRTDKRVRIASQLIDASNGAHIWADKFDSGLEDIFDLQDRITNSVIGAISPRLLQAEFDRVQRKPIENLQAYDYVLRAQACTHKYTAEANAEGLRYAETAIGLDPGLALPHALAANFHCQRKGFPFGLAPDVSATRRFASRALELDGQDPTVLTLSGWALADIVGDLDDGAAYLLRAIDLDPNMVAARIWSGYAQIYLGNPLVAVEQCSLAVRLSPLDPRMFLAHAALAMAYFLEGRYDDSLAYAATAMRLRPNLPSIHRAMIAAQAMLGMHEIAQKTCARLLELDSTQRISRIRGLPFRRAEDIRRLQEAYRLAGMPE